MGGQHPKLETKVLISADLKIATLKIPASFVQLHMLYGLAVTKEGNSISQMSEQVLFFQ